MREHVMSELRKMIEEALVHEIPRELERKDFKGVQQDCELVIGFMLEHFADRLVEDPYTGPSSNYVNFLKALRNIASSGVNAKNANLLFKCLKAFYEGVFVVIPKSAQGK